MPIDMNKINEAKQRAIQDGYDPNQVEAYAQGLISKKQKEEDYINKASEAVIRGFDINAVPQEYRMDVYSSALSKSQGSAIPGTIQSDNEDKLGYQEDLGNLKLKQDQQKYDWQMSAEEKEQQKNIDTIISDVAYDKKVTADEAKQIREGLDLSEASMVFNELRNRGITIEDIADSSYRNKISSLGTGGERTAVSDYTSFLRSAADALSSLEGLGRESAATGAIARWAPIFGSKEAKQVRSDVGTFADDIRNKIFGAAVTETEIRKGNIPDKGEQEPENRRRIQSLYNKKAVELEERLKAAGLSDGEIDAYFKDAGITRSVSAASNDGTETRNADYYINKYYE